MLSLEGCICLWTVGAQAVDCKTSLRERLIAVTEETNLGSAWTVLARDLEFCSAQEASGAKVMTAAVLLIRESILLMQFSNIGTPSSVLIMHYALHGHDRGIVVASNIIQ